VFNTFIGTGSMSFMNGDRVTIKARWKDRFRERLMSEITKLELVAQMLGRIKRSGGKACPATEGKDPTDRSFEANGLCAARRTPASASTRERLLAGFTLAPAHRGYRAILRRR